MNITIKKSGELTSFIWKGIKIDVDAYSTIPEPNALGGKYLIKDSKIKDATVYVDGTFHRESILDHFVVEEAMKDLDNKSWGKSICPEVWK
jgi:hypothetical protein